LNFEFKFVFNPYQSRTAKIVRIFDQAPGIKLFEFVFEKKHFKLSLEEDFYFNPGQFIILSLPGFGEAPFAPCNDMRSKNLELCVRKTGKLTDKLHGLKRGDEVGIRGPFGVGWPVGRHCGESRPAGRRGNLERISLSAGSPLCLPADRDDRKKNLLIVAGGLGMIPLRSLILSKDLFFGKEALVQIFYGAKSPEEFLFKDEFADWRKKGIDLQLTIDKECPGWSECVGLVTVLLDKRNIVPDAKAFLCGPPVMYKFSLQKVKERKFKDEDIYLSLERRMHCGVGVCQHCAVGPFYTCKDGPVFSYKQIKDIQGAI
jgi:sulfhydrogenase subunit gamma (sulfur reductase)